MSRNIGLAYAFEILTGDSLQPERWSFTIMHMPRGLYTVVLIRDWRDVFTLLYRDLLLDAQPSPYRPQSRGKLKDIPADVLHEVGRALCAIERSSVEDRVLSLSRDVWSEVE